MLILRILRMILEHHRLMQQNSFRYLPTEFFESYPTNSQVDYQLYHLVLSTFNKLFVDALMETGYEFALPGRIGTLSIRKRKGGRLLDFGHYQKTGEKITQKNKHSQGYYARFIWDTRTRYTALPVYKTMFEFKAARANNRTLAKLIKDKNYINKYFENE